MAFKIYSAIKQHYDNQARKCREQKEQNRAREEKKREEEERLEKATVNNRGNIFAQMPHDCLHNILLFLSIPDVVQSSSVCKSWYNAYHIMPQGYWKEFTKNHTSRSAFENLKCTDSADEWKDVFQNSYFYSNSEFVKRAMKKLDTESKRAIYEKYSKSIKKLLEELDKRSFSENCIKVSEGYGDGCVMYTDQLYSFFSAKMGVSHALRKIKELLISAGDDDDDDKKLEVLYSKLDKLVKQNYLIDYFKQKFENIVAEIGLNVLTGKKCQTSDFTTQLK